LPKPSLAPVSYTLISGFRIVLDGQFWPETFTKRMLMTVDEKLDWVIDAISTLVGRQAIKDYYEVDEFAELVKKAPFTVREWCRHGRIRAEKRLSGRGAHPGWAISHAELERYRRQGLLPIQKLR
jgi:hypothetical protein